MTLTVTLEGVCKSFAGKTVLEGVDIAVPASSSLVVLGGSGSGKSVMLKCILGLITPDAGRILIDGRDVAAMSRRERAALMDRIGMLFQNGALFDSLPVWENVCFKLLAQKRITRAQAFSARTHIPAPA
jgi:phospholipid/cholesterol/gamma-HCH transport system ATP-binding protein